MSLPKLPPVRCWHRRVATRAVPMRLFEALYADESHAFLYESLEASGQQGRYSFIGARPRAVFSARGERLTLSIDGIAHEATGDALDALRDLVDEQADAPPIAPFCGGAVGYLAYDTVRWTEKIPETNPDDLGAPDALFIVPREIICFDHVEKTAHVLLYEDGGREARFETIRRAADALDAQRGEEQPFAGFDDAATADPPLLESNMTRAEFEAIVARAKEYILAGDIFQVVLSQRFEFALRAAPLRLYQALRRTNPSPYMYYLRLGDLDIAGSSPEVLVTQTGRRVETRPLAGTRRRGRTAEEDAALARELLADDKERAEHVMLVDLGRNDLGRVCEFGSVQVSKLLEIERHSRVMHLVSNVDGWRREDASAFDVYRAVFPAGTVSGAPKVRAMEIIEELETRRRGVYAGAIGYFSVLGDVDLCIAIRTIVMRGGRGFIQAGAGIVADSIPAREYQETVNKARALMRAVALAERG